MSRLILDSPYHAWVYLNRVLEGPSRTLHALSQEYPVEDIAHAVYRREDWIGRLRDETASRYDWLRQEEDMAAASAVGARLITPDDAEWPTHEFQSAFGFYGSGGAEAPANFDSEAVPPHSLWVRGGNLAHAVAQSVAIVGTRAVTRYGFEATRMIAQDLVKHQWALVSGGALGVDTVAHEAALDNGGSTVVVAACGIDHPYPARNRAMFDRVASQGCIISEFPLGSTPQRHRFLTRNRLVAALTAGTVIMEAAFRSGALNTANWAEALGKTVMAVPGPITSPGSLGCHLRIQEGRAQLVTNADQIRELISKVGEVDAVGQYELEFTPNPEQKLSRNELKVYGSTPPWDVREGARAEDISRECGLRLPLTVHILIALEKQGMITRTGALWQRSLP